MLYTFISLPSPCFTHLPLFPLHLLHIYDSSVSMFCTFTSLSSLCFIPLSLLLLRVLYLSSSSLCIFYTFAVLPSPRFIPLPLFPLHDLHSYPSPLSLVETGAQSWLFLSDLPALKGWVAIIQSDLILLQGFAVKRTGARLLGSL